MTLQYVEISGTFEDGQGNPLTGTATFTPNVTIYASGVPVLQAGVSITAEIVAGQLRNLSGGTFQLLATDNAGITFAGQTGYLAYTVSVTLSGQVLNSWSFFLPHATYGNGPVDLFALANTAAQGGFVSPMTTLGDMITGGAAGIATRLAGNTTAAREFLVSQGTGTAAQAPAWSALGASDIPQLADYAPTGLTGATAPTRYAGGTASGAPVSGTFAVGDFVIDQTAKVWVCTAAGSPGTWAQAGGGSVTSVSVASANGFAGTVANPTTTPAITLETLVTGIMKGNGTAVSAAVPGTDYVVPAGNAATATNLAGAATFPAEVSPKVVTLTQSAGAVAVNGALGNVFRLVLTASGWTLSNPTGMTDGQPVRVRLIQDATGGRTISYGTAWDFGAAGAPTLSPGANKVDYIVGEYSADARAGAGAVVVSPALGF